MGITPVALPAPFTWVNDHIGIALPGARAAFTTRRGGVSEGAPFRSLNLGSGVGDDPEHVNENRLRAARLADPLAKAPLLVGRQVHGSHVAVHRAGTRLAAAERPAEADGQATDRRHSVAAVLAADCLPIVLAARRAVAVVHGGWRGLAGGLVAEGVRALRALGTSGRIVAAIGPGAGPCCYAVGDEVRAAFARHGSAVRRGRALDLKAVAHLELTAAGVEEVHDVALCTICAPALFFSHRRDGAPTGRHAGLVVRA